MQHIVKLRLFLGMLSISVSVVLNLSQIFKRFHAAYVDAVSNPFYTINTVSLHSNRTGMGAAQVSAESYNTSQ